MDSGFSSICSLFSVAGLYSFSNQPKQKNHLSAFSNLSLSTNSIPSFVSPKSIPSSKPPDVSENSHHHLLHHHRHLLHPTKKQAPYYPKPIDLTLESTPDISQHQSQPPTSTEPESAHFKKSHRRIISFS